MFSCCEFSSKNTFLQTTSGQLLILLCDFIFEPFSMIDFISPTNKDHYIKCICSKCFWEGITKSWIYYQFVARTVVNKYFNNEQKQTNDSVRKELVDFKKRRKKEGVIISVLNFFLPISPLWFSILNNLLITDSLIGIVKDFVSRFFTMFQFYTPPSPFYTPSK